MRLLFRSLVIAFVLLPLHLHAASLYLTPASGNYSVGDTVSVGIVVESASQALNAVSGAVSIPNGFEVLGVSTAGSIVNFWVAQPSVTGSLIQFEGVVLNPGYTGTSGRIATITLRASRTGSFPLSYTTASILANDGKGTSLLSGTRGSTFIVGARTTPALTEEPEEEPIDEEDTQGPLITQFSERTRSSASDPEIEVRIQAQDPSGVASYEFSLDGGAFLPWEMTDDGVYTLTLGPGAHTLGVKVIDSVGNETKRQIVLTVAPLPTPRILAYPQEPALGTAIELHGDAAPGITKVIVTTVPQEIAPQASLFGKRISTVPMQHDAEVSADGTWRVSLHALNAPGTYHASAVAYDERGAASLPSEAVTLSVVPDIVAAVLGFVFSAPVLLLALLIALGVGLYQARRGHSRASKEIGETKRSLAHSFNTMLKNIRRERALIRRDRDSAGEREEELLETLEENITTAEARAEKELRDIERASKD